MLGVLDARAARAARCSRSATRSRPRCARRPPRAGCSSPTSPTATTSASSPTATPPAWLRERLGEAPGDVVDAESGETVGHHDGAYAFTVGQRRGLALGRPAADGGRRYVVGVDLPTSTVLVGPPVLLEVDRVEGERAALVRPRARRPGRGPGAAARPRRAGRRRRRGRRRRPGAAVVASLRARVRGVAPGQAVVLYDGTRVVGSATITEPPAPDRPTLVSPTSAAGASITMMPLGPRT